jgi:hypothetical protein
MDKTAFKEYLDKRYFDQLNYYDRSAGINQKRYKLFQWVLIVLSAITPIVAALDITWMSLKMPVVIISALVAILTTGLKTFQYQELWVIYRATNEKLKHELYYYNFDVGPYADNEIDKEALFVSRVESILDTEHKNWPAIKKSQGDNKQKNLPVTTHENLSNTRHPSKESE